MTQQTSDTAAVGQAFMQALARKGLHGPDADEFIANLNHASFTDERGAPDQVRIDALADRIAPDRGAGRVRDFGGGSRGSTSPPEPGADGRAEAARRYGTDEPAPVARTGQVGRRGLDEADRRFPKTKDQENRPT